MMSNDVAQSMARIPLQNGQWALVDACDEELLSGYKWSSVTPGRSRTIYAVAYRGQKLISMHRVLLEEPTLFVDHANGNGLDNRRSNLRLCTHAENIRNQRKRASTTSRFKGVRYVNRDHIWRVEIEQNGIYLHLGCFKDEVRAAQQYDRAARVLFGKFALTNADLGLL